MRESLPQPTVNMGFGVTVAEKRKNLTGYVRVKTFFGRNEKIDGTFTDNPQISSSEDHYISPAS
jgi:hypothetical protein